MLRRKATNDIDQILIQAIRSDALEDASKCQKVHDKAICTAAIYGSLHRGLSNFHYFPNLFTGRKDMPYSLSEYLAIIRGLKIVICEGAIEYRDKIILKGGFQRFGSVTMAR